MDLASLGALALVSAEWCAIGRVSGLAWAADTVRWVRWSLYLLGGAFILGLTELLLSLIGLGFDNAALTLALAALLALAIRAVAQPPPRSRRKVRFGQRERISW